MAGTKHNNRDSKKSGGLSRVFNLNGEVELSLSGSDGEHNISARVVEIAKNYISVEIMEEIEKGIKLQVDTGVIINVEVNELLYKFKAMVAVVENENIFRLTLESEFGAIQRREFIRVETYLPFRYRVLREEEVEQKKSIVMDRPGPIQRIHEEDISNNPMGALLLEINSKLDRLLYLTEGRQLDQFVEGEEETMKNISGSGISFDSTRELTLDTIVELEFRLPLNVPSEIHALGIVVRSDKKGEDSLNPFWYTGINFTVINNAEKEEVIKYTFMRQRKMIMD